jgi:hypothetical protein
MYGDEGYYQDPRYLPTTSSYQAQPQYQQEAGIYRIDPKTGCQVQIDPDTMSYEMKVKYIVNFLKMKGVTFEEFEDIHLPRFIRTLHLSVAEEMHIVNDIPREIYRRKEPEHGPPKKIAPSSEPPPPPKAKSIPKAKPPEKNWRHSTFHDICDEDGVPDFDKLREQAETWCICQKTKWQTGDVFGDTVSANTRIKNMALSDSNLDDSQRWLILRYAERMKSCYAPNVGLILFLGGVIMMVMAAIFMFILNRKREDKSFGMIFFYAFGCGIGGSFILISPIWMIYGYFWQKETEEMKEGCRAKLKSLEPAHKP